MTDSIRPSLITILGAQVLSLLESKTTWAAVATFLVNVATAAGYKIDPLWANSLPDILLNIGSCVGTILTIYLHQRTKQAISKAISTPTVGASA